MSLGEFEIYPPLGLEHLQVIASKEDLVQRLPEYRFDEGSEFYLVGKGPADGLAKTRAAKRPKKKKPENYSADLHFHVEVIGGGLPDPSFPKLTCLEQSQAE